MKHTSTPIPYTAKPATLQGTPLPPHLERTYILLRLRRGRNCSLFAAILNQRTSARTLYPNHQPHERKANNACQDRIRNGTGFAIGGRPPRQVQAESSIHDAQQDQHAAVPDVDVGPDGALLGSLESAVMEEAKDGLQDESGDDDGSQYRMGVVMEL